MINWVRVWNMFGFAFISTMFGIGSEPLITKWNYNNYVYGHYASYAMTALLMIFFLIRYIDVSKKKEKKQRRRRKNNENRRRNN